MTVKFQHIFLDCIIFTMSYCNIIIISEILEYVEGLTSKGRNLCLISIILWFL